MALGRMPLTASCQAVAEVPGTARRWRLQAQQQTGLGAWPQGSRSPRSWWLRQARRRTGTGRKWLEGTGRRLGWLVYTQGRARTVTGQGWQGSPRWAAQWLVGRCSGESACGPSRVSVAVGRVGGQGCREQRADLCPALPKRVYPSTKQMQQLVRCAPTPGLLHRQCHHCTGHLAPVLPVPSSSDLTPTLPYIL